MSVSFAFAIYVVIWWTVLFAILPIGVRTQGEDGTIVRYPGERADASAIVARRAAHNCRVGSRVRRFVGGRQIRSDRPRAIARTSHDALSANEKSKADGPCSRDCRSCFQTPHALIVGA